MVILAYAGPEAVLPLTSLIAAAASLVVLFGRTSLRYLVGMVRGRRRPLGRAPAAAHVRKSV